jgi:hypothetical protein
MTFSLFFLKSRFDGRFWAKFARIWAVCMMYPRVFAQKVGHTRDNLQRDVCGFTIKPQKGPAEKGRKQAVFGGNEYGVAFTGSPHFSTRERPAEDSGRSQNKGTGMA